MDEQIWIKLRNKLLDAITKFLDFEIDPVKQSSLREEAQKFTSALLDYGKSQLNKPGIDNQKSLAEIEELYSKAQRNNAETRKINAEAAAIELDNRIKTLQLVLAATKTMIVNQPGQESNHFITDIERFQGLLEVFQEGSTSVAG